MFMSLNLQFNFFYLWRLLILSLLQSSEILLILYFIEPASYVSFADIQQFLLTDTQCSALSRPTQQCNID